MTTTSAEHGPAATMRRNALAALPVPMLLGALLLALAGAPPLIALVLGAAGWLLALVLRQPIALLVSRRTTPERTATIVGWCSGPAEELVRLALVLLAIRSTEDALWAGFGWATVEVLLVVVNGIALASLITKTDAKSLEARALLEAQGMLGAQQVVWGVLERVSATAVHIGFTLLLFAQPWLVLVTLPLHSVINMSISRLAKRHLAATELVFAAVAAVVLWAGLAVTL
ncbi:hypothetical protein [Agrococcus carbonis]|uniref:YhfC family intramembrane metalloprotease n=1 Tax=Agrococcus carbonis TaxID=684552 RepID=A0A1H1MWA2_9MICO|nr:hypothetical protein [Agrococcus carbonis]SDR90907.1 hypothetical protein SAMN04489719_1098 [Agrococcus carbonis]